MSYDNFGDRMKGYERLETSPTFDPALPLYARIDGRGFSKFTKGMDRPFDGRMSMAMIQTTKMLVERTNALMGYCQSDEISLLWNLFEEEKPEQGETQFIFDGKKQKMVSVLAGLATAAFTNSLNKFDLEDYIPRMPHFDARVFSLPSRTEAANAFLWREQDATKNAISMAAHSVFSHKSLQGKNSQTKIDMMEEAGVDFHGYPPYFRQGTFVRRVTETRVLTEAERMVIPEKNRPAENQPFTRSRISTIVMPPFRLVTNREGVLFNAELPVTAEA